MSAVTALQLAMDELQAKESAIDARRAAVEEEIARMRAELRAEQQAFEGVSRVVESAVVRAQTNVKLNVGGARYETTRSTLETQSLFFAHMLSGRHGDAVSTSDGCIFIDRDGELFAPILEFMRGARPRVGALDRDKLLEEARYYCIDTPGAEEPFSEALRQPESHGGHPMCELSRAEIIRALVPGVPVVLRGIALRGVDISYLGLASANLSMTDLSNANLAGADLSQVKFSGSNLSGSNLSNAILSKAVFSKANLSGADMTGAILWEANLSGANLSGANLTRADLTNAVFAKANLSSANFSYATLSMASLSEANTSGADFSNTTLVDGGAIKLSNNANQLPGANLFKSYLWSQESALTGRGVVKVAPRDTHE